MPFISSNCNPLHALKSCVALPMARLMTKTAMIQTAWDARGEEAEQKTGSLSDYTVNPQRRSQAGRIDPLIGRKHEMERLAIS